MDDRSVRRWRRALLAAGAGLVLAGALTWTVDTLAAHRRPLDTVTLYVATKLKNGQTEIYYNQPITEACVRALFPHGGRTPCWYLRRSPLKRI